jgi:predicted RND superfamily exporter protein
LDGKNGYENKNNIYITTVIVIILGIIGLYQIRVSGSLIEDMPKAKPFIKTLSSLKKSLGELCL